MNLETFFEKFDLFADCPNAVQKMRELILELAVQGKLVEQGSDDWRAIVLGDVIELISGQHLLAHEHNDQGKGIPYLTGPSDFGEHYPVPTRWTEFPKVVAEPGDILITVKGAGVGKTNFLKEQKTAISRQLMAIRVVGSDADYVHLVLKKAASHFQATMVGIAIPGIGRKDVLSLELVLPPLAEQKRIVAKVDELMALCDALEAQQKERETKRTALAKASLAAFAEAPSPQCLELLFHPSYAIDPADLRKSILTLAVQGKLVEQDCEDEDASSLLQRVMIAREAVSKEQSRKLPKETLVVALSEAPHPVPDSWLWVRLGSLSTRIEYGTSQKSSDDSRLVPVYRMGNIQCGVLLDENMKFVDTSIDDLPALYLKGNDILFNRTNSAELVGKTAIYLGADDCATFASYLIRIRLESTNLLPRYFNLSMNAPYYRETQINPEIVQQCGQANFNGTKLASTLVPLPPLTEQKRIVAKVDELMVLVDRLEAKEKAARETASRLLEAMVAELSGRAAA